MNKQDGREKKLPQLTKKVIGKVLKKKDVLPDKEDAGIPGQELADKVISKMKSYKEDLSHLNIIICGKTGVGKSTLINSVFCGNLADTGIGFPVTSEIRLFPDENFRTDIPLRIYDTPGFELDAVQRSSIKEQIKSVIDAGNGNDDRCIHCIWYCINTMASKIEQEEINYINELRQLTAFGSDGEKRSVPVIIVLTQSIVKSRADQLTKVIKSSDSLANAVIPVLAREEAIDSRTTVKAFGMDKLVEKTEELAPFISDTLTSVQIVSLKQKQKNCRSVVNLAAVTALGVGAAPVPFADAPLLVSAEIAMIAKITVLFGFEADKSVMMGILSSALGTGGATLLGRTVVSNLLKLTGVGAVAGGLISGSTAAVITIALGEAYIQLLSMVFRGELKKTDLSSDKGRKKFRQLFKEALKTSKDSDIYKSLSADGSSEVLTEGQAIGDTQENK
ncbi:YcjF family protein [Ruminococcus flavefaciens]|uniref:YcjF family protein n=1 Tax=Ruminococcus flavefaciens TaxID=1265 RepID=UPI0002E2DFDE|nr:DUF697 domain-containing protein [Ruminococcus flavefaciens]